MPIKKLASKGKAKIVEEASPSSPVAKKKRSFRPTPEVLDESWGEVSKKRFEEYLGFSVLNSMEVSMHDVGMSAPPLTPLIRTQKLNKFLSLRCSCYPNLVRRFYANLRQTDNQDWVTRVKGIKIILSPRTFSHFDLPNIGEDLITETFQTYKKTKQEVVEELVGGEWVYEQLTSGQQKITTYSLPFVNRLLILIINNTLMLKKGHLDEMKNVALLAMHLMHYKMPINWAKFLFTTMTSPMSKSLPYGNLVSYIMIRNGVDVSNETEVIPQKVLDHKFIARISVGTRSTHGIPTHLLAPIGPGQVPQEEGDEDSEEDREEEEEPEMTDTERILLKLEELDVKHDEFRADVSSRLDRLEGSFSEFKHSFYKQFPPAE